MIETGELITALHHLAGYTEAREWTDEEKEKRGFNKNDCCGILGCFSIDNPPMIHENQMLAREKT